MFTWTQKASVKCDSLSLIINYNLSPKQIGL